MIAAACYRGEVLAQKRESLGVTPVELARRLHVPANCIMRIVNGKRTVTGDPELRLAYWFGDDPEQWMTLLARYDLEVAVI